MIEPPADTGTNQPVVECRNVTREYRRGNSRGDQSPIVTALDGVSLALQEQEFVGVAGSSGSGKSTLLHLLAALDTPTSGTVHLCGQNTGSITEQARANLRLNKVGIVFQRFHLLPSISAGANVALPLVEMGVNKQTRQDMAEQLLNSVGLSDRIDHKPSALSGGEQQRVAIARALVTEPRLLVADEPTGEVDTATASKLLDLFEELAQDHAVVLASHDDQALKRADRIIRLKDGRIDDD